MPFDADTTDRTAPISSRVSQDVQLLAGAQDHYVPLHQFYDQIAMLKQVRSLTARLFTRQKQAQNHTQTGNLGLSVQVMVDWLDSMQETGKEPRLHALRNEVQHETIVENSGTFI